MAEKCFACKKNIGFLDSRRSIVGSEHMLCTRCFSKFGPRVNIMQNMVTQENATPLEFMDHYVVAKNSIEEGDFEPDVRDDLLKDLEQLKEKAFSAHPGWMEEVVDGAIQDAEMQDALSDMLITSGFNFDGYTITKYSGYISGDDAITIPRNDFFDSNNVADNLCAAFVKIRRQALKELKEAAYNLGCNAVIGVDFDYVVIEPQHNSALNATVTVYEPYVIAVTANGNAVVIEKDGEEISTHANPLREYKALLDEGVITLEEFIAKKKELL